MAKIDLIRRAEIGREKRAKTRALILEASAVIFFWPSGLPSG